MPSLESLYGDRIRELETENKRLRTLIARSPLFRGPCPFCLYNGPGFYQPKTHECAKLRFDPQSEMEALQFSLGIYPDVRSVFLESKDEQP